MIVRFLLSLFWFTLAQHQRHQWVEQILNGMPMEACGLVDLVKPEAMLAPPPIHLSGPIPNEGKAEITSVEVEGKKFFVLSIKGHIAITEAKEKAAGDPQKGNGKPTDPIIIEKPGGKFFVKFPGKNWVDIQTLEADDPMLADLLRAAGGIAPPPPPSGYDGNGDGDDAGEGDPAPFGFGDLVTSKSRPELGVLRVIGSKKEVGADGKKYWRTSTMFVHQGGVSTYSAAASDFVFYGRTE